MRIFIAACFGILAASCGAPQPAPTQVEQAPIVIADAWAGASPPGVTVAAGYLTISNTQATEDALVGVSSTRAGRAEIHEMAMDGAVMRMRPVARLAIPAGGAVTLAPGGQHLMFYDVSTPLAAGETIDVTLTFANAGDMLVTLPVRARENSGHGGH